MTWIELNHLAKFLIKESKRQNMDYQTIDFRSIIDATLTYEENLDALKEAMGAKSDIAEMEKAYAEVLTDLEKEEKIADLEIKVANLERRLEKAKEERKLEANVRQFVEKQLAEVKKKLEPKLLTVKLTRFIPAFIGADKKTYGPFNSDQIAELLEADANYLVRQGMAQPHAIPTLKEDLRKEAENLWDDYRSALLTSETQQAANILARLKELRPKVVTA